MREIKIRAAREDRKLKDVIADLLRRGLARKPSKRPAVRSRVKLPLVRCAHEASPDEEMTPERIARILMAEDTETPRGSLR